MKKFFTNLKVALTLLLLCGVCSAWCATGSFKLVTDASSLKSGDVIVLGCAAQEAAAGAMGTGTFLTSASATINNGVLTSAGAIEITLGGSVEEGWTLTTSEGIITTSKAKALKLDDGTVTTCTIAITAEGNATITFGSYGSIQYNTQSPRFANYTSKQTAIEIYKKTAAPTTAYTVTFDAGDNGSCSTTSLKEEKAGEGVTLPSCTPNSGFAFLGWATTKDAATANAGNAGKTYIPSSDVTLYAVYEKLIAVTGITFDPASANLKQGRTLQLTPIIAPATASNKAVTWSSNNDKVTVSESGLVTVAADATPGSTVTITATATDGSNVTGTFTVTVEEFIATWANTYTSNITLPSVGGCKVNIDGETYDGIKAGTGSSAGSMTVKVPANTKTLHMHLVGWGAETVTVDIDGEEYDILSDTGVKGNSPFTIAGNAEEYYLAYEITNSKEHDMVIKAVKGNRFVLFGVNAEQGTTNKVDVEITSAGYATAYLPFAATVKGATAYYVTVDGDYAKLNEISGTIPANTGVVIKGEAGTVTFTESAETPASVEGNLLLGTAAAEGAVYDAANTTYYILSTGSNGVGFYWDPASTAGEKANCAQYKAVLAVSGNGAAPRFISFDEATGIEAIHSVNENENIYNLNGVRVNGNYKGIVIINGKKVVK